jgi:transcriptional regulator with XRE-family HTH domain
MAKNFKILKEKLSPQARARAHALALQDEAEMPLAAIREARNLTQSTLAGILGINQPAVSKMERQTDMYISSLRSMIQAMGGKLQIEAVFPDGRIFVNQFHELEEDIMDLGAAKKTNGRSSRTSGRKNGNDLKASVEK